MTEPVLLYRNDEVIVLYHDDAFTFLYPGEGGPVISDPDYIKGLEMYNKGLALARSIQKLEHFKEHGTWISQKN